LRYDECKSKKNKSKDYRTDPKMTIQVRLLRINSIMAYIFLSTKLYQHLYQIVRTKIAMIREYIVIIVFAVFASILLTSTFVSG